MMCEFDSLFLLPLALIKRGIFFRYRLRYFGAFVVEKKLNSVPYLKDKVKFGSEINTHFVSRSLK